MSEESHPSASALTEAWSAVLRSDASEREIELLRFHAMAPDCTVTMPHVARHLGFESRLAVDAAYTELAIKVANRLNLPKPVGGFWAELVMKRPMRAMVRWQFVLRPEVVRALKETGIVSASRGANRIASGPA